VTCTVKGRGHVKIARWPNGATRLGFWLPATEVVDHRPPPTASAFDALTCPLRFNLKFAGKVMRFLTNRMRGTHGARS
jgi:hypothetical protein